MCTKQGAILLLISLVALVIPFSNAQWNPNFVSGRTVIVHLFEWRWTDIALECERYLSGERGFAGVQVSPPNENAIVTSPFRPWYERYQPVSFKLESRSGTESEFIDMVRRCNAKGVRIYVDAVINHMTGNSVVGQGTGGSSFDARSYDFPGVPYSRDDFNGNATCPTASGQIEDYQDIMQIRNCEYVALRDLDHGKQHVRDMIVNYFNKLVGIGVAGFRVDLCKHMWPADLHEIFSRVNNLSTDSFPEGTRPFIVQEVTDVGDWEPIRGSEYHGNGRTTEFRFGIYLGEIFRKANGHKLSTLKNYGEGWGMYGDNNVLVFVDNHDNQRGHGASGEYILTFRNAKWYKMAQVFALAWNYGVVRIMSSYYWELDVDPGTGADRNDWVGPPNVDGVTSGVVINPDETCGGGWICEHRWRQIGNMVRFRNVVEGEGVSDWWDNGGNQIAFSRGAKGFIAVNNEGGGMNVRVRTGMRAGVYCDVITGERRGDGGCSGRTVVVGDDGMVEVDIGEGDEDSMIAIHV